MTNWILMPVRNNLALTRRAVASCLQQDVVTPRVLLIDNNSTDGTRQWAETMYPDVIHLWRKPPLSVAASWNEGLSLLFGPSLCEQVLVVNNDVELLPETYELLYEDGGGFVTAVSVKEREKLDEWKPEEYKPNERPHPDFSCYLIRNDTWDTVGRFNEGFKGAFCEDWDYHVRMHKAGIYAHCIDIPFYHVGSATIKNMSPEDREKLQAQAAKNREYFKKIHGMEGASEEYYAFFKEAHRSSGEGKSQ